MQSEISAIPALTIWKKVRILMLVMKKFFVIVICLISVNCFAGMIDTMRIDDVVKVFMHLPGDYSIMYREKDKTYHTARFSRIDYHVEEGTYVSEWLKSRKYDSFLKSIEILCEITIIEDVTDGPMYADVLFINHGDCLKIKIHISNHEVFGGGEWKTGGRRPKTYNTEVVR